MKLVETKKVTEAEYAYCHECDKWLGNQYWTLSKTIGLHKGGCPDHEVDLYRMSA